MVIHRCRDSLESKQMHGIKQSCTCTCRGLVVNVITTEQGDQVAVPNAHADIALDILAHGEESSPKCVCAALAEASGSSRPNRASRCDSHGAGSSGIAPRNGSTSCTQAQPTDATHEIEGLMSHFCHISCANTCSDGAAQVCVVPDTSGMTTLTGAHTSQASRNGSVRTLPASSLMLSHFARTRPRTLILCDPTRQRCPFTHRCAAEVAQIAVSLWCTRFVPSTRGGGQLASEWDWSPATS